MLAILSHRDRNEEARRWQTTVERFWKWFTVLGVERPLIDESLENATTEPGSWLAFTHGDPAPSDVHVSREQVRFIDLEYCGFRHALYDVTGWEALVPTTALVLGAMRTAYREELAQAFSEAEDAQEFDVVYSRQLLIRAVGVTAWFPTDIVNEDRPTPGGGMRRQVLYAFDRVAHAASQIRSLQPLAEVVHSRLLPAMKAAWSSDR